MNKSANCTVLKSLTTGTSYWWEPGAPGRAAAAHQHPWPPFLPWGGKEAGSHHLKPTRNTGEGKTNANFISSEMHFSSFSREETRLSKAASTNTKLLKKQPTLSPTIVSVM